MCKRELSDHNILGGRVDKYNTDVKVSDIGKYKINQIYKNPLNHEATWKKGTPSIVGDIMLYGIDESKIRNAKVRIFPGASIDDLVVHRGTSNCVYDNSRVVMDKLMNLKMFISSQIQKCEIVFSSLIKRNDNRKA